MQTCRGRFFKDSIFFFQVFAVVIELFFLNGFRTLIFLDAVAREGRDPSERLGVAVEDDLGTTRDQLCDALDALMLRARARRVPRQGQRKGKPSEKVVVGGLSWHRGARQ